jgi:hypothetical protein
MLDSSNKPRPICDMPNCTGQTYVGPLCGDHFREFRGSSFAGNAERWIVEARERAGFAARPV